MTIKSANFAVGQIIHNTLFAYRGVIIDGARQHTYVAERNLEADDSGAPVRHRDVGLYFDGMGDNGYILRRKEH